MDALRKAWRFVRQWWWLFVAVAGTVLVVVWRLVAMKPRADPATPSVLPPPTFADRAHEEVERVRLEGEVEKARVTATADVHRAEIDRIEELGETDPRGARRQLAGWLGRNL